MNLRMSLISFFFVFFFDIRLFLIQLFLIYPIFELFVNSPCFCALFWPSNPCFIPNLKVSVKCAKRNRVPSHETGYQFHIFAGSYSDKPWFNKGHMISSEGPAAGEKFSLISFPISCVLFSSWLLIWSPVHGKLRPRTPSFRYLLFTGNSSSNTLWRTTNRG
jgi:hypothetical protein